MQLFSGFFRLIKEHYRETRNAKDYAGMLGISYKHLNEISRQTCRLTAKQAIDQLVIIEAKRLLAVDDDSIENLSITLGFDETTNFIKMAYEGKPREAVAQFVGDDYIQHNPDVANGTQGFIDYFERMQREYADKSIEFVRGIAEGDLVALHTHQTWPGNEEYVTMDFFRFDDKGKIVEHWDSIQQIPAQSANPNSMY